MFEQILIEGNIIESLMGGTIVLSGARLAYGLLCPTLNFEGLSYMIKAAIYGLLTGLFYYYTKKHGFEKMSILNAFALVFCCLEAFDSLASFIVFCVKGSRNSFKSNQ